MANTGHRIVPRGLPVSSAAWTSAWYTLTQESKSFFNNTQSLSVLREFPWRSSAVPSSSSPQPGRGTCPMVQGAFLLSRQLGECSSTGASQRRLAHAHLVGWFQFPASKADTITWFLLAKPETAAACTEPKSNPLTHLGSPEEPHGSDNCTTGHTRRSEIRGIER